MSFPRAKISRFNDIQNCTPSPADYNPKIKSHVAGAILSTTERFSEHKSPAVSDTTSIHSLNSTTCFRTPTLPKKKKHTTPSISKLKSSCIFDESVLNEEALSEKIVECNNKDLYITELTEQIEDMKVQLSKLKLQKDELEDEKMKFEKFLEQLQNAHKSEIENVNGRHFDELKILQEQITNTQTKLEFANKEFNKLKAENLEERYENLIKHIKENHELELENLQLDYDNEHIILKGHIAKIKNEMVLARNEWNKLKLENRQDIEALLQNIQEFQKLYNILITAYHEEINVKEEIISKEKQANIELENKMKQLLETQKIEMHDLQAKHKLEIEDIEYEMLKTITELQNKLDQEKKLLETMYKSKITNLENRYNEEVIRLQNETQLEIEQIKDDCKTSNLLTETQLQEKYDHIENEWKLKLEIQLQQFQKLLQEYKEINEFNLTQYKVEKEHLTEEMNEKLQIMEKTWKTKLDEQIKESEDILKECQAISEYNIIQCEVEKNDTKQKLIATLDELENEKENKSKCQSEKDKIDDLYSQLKLNYDDVITRLETTQEKLTKVKQEHENETRQILNEKYTYEKTIIKTREAVEALTTRLFDSDRDVEQLKLELENCEKEKLEVEDKHHKLIIEHETMTKLYEDMELQNESNLKLSESKIRKLERELLGKVNEYQKKIEDSITQNTVQIKEKTGQLEEMKEQLHQQQILNSEAQNLISNVSLELEKYEGSNDELVREVATLTNDLQLAMKKVAEVEETNKELREQLKEQAAYKNKLETSIKEPDLKNEEIQSLLKQINQLQEKSDSYYQYCDYYKCKANEYEKEIEDLNVIQKNYIDQSGKYDDLLQKYEELLAKNAELEKTVMEQETLIGPFREQLEAYEMERAALINQKHDAENEARIMGMKYAQILGHQNQKQKIKHLIDLKRKNYDLLESKAEIEQKVRAQAKTIDKLKKEISLLTKSPRKLANIDKENMNSPNRTLNNSSHIQSPLKERN